MIRIEKRNVCVLSGLLIMLFVALSPVNAVAQTDETSHVQWYFAKMDREATEMPIKMKDSIFNALMSKYISEFRTMGQEAALDSLSKRSNAVITKYQPKRKKGKNRYKLNSTNREKIDELLLQKAEIDAKIASLEREERLTKMFYIIDNEIDKAHAKADSLTLIQMTRSYSEFYIKPIVFDSISCYDFLPLFTYDGIHYLEKRDSTKILPDTYFEKMYRKNKIETLFWRRNVSTYAVEQPEVIEYADLEAYDSRLVNPSASDRNLYIEDVDKYKSEPTFEILSKLMKKKETGPWSSYKKLTIHFSQYYVNNWYKGGTPNSTLLSILRYDKNYNKNDKITWDNSLYTEIGFYNTSQDTIRAFRVNNDEFDITSRFGYYTGYKKLYYSASAYFRSSLFTSHNGINSNEVLTSFLSPTTLTFGVGADYRYNKRTFIQLSPLAYRMIFILDGRVDPVAQGVKHGKSASFFGYMVYGELYWKFSREINFTSKANIFCSYPHDYMEMEIDLVGNFIINRFLSSRISFKLRTDNKETIETGIQEQLSLGFNYEF